MALFQELNAQGITIVLVTHEPDIAAYASRIVEVRDGKIRRDHPVDSRRSAVADLAALASISTDEENDNDFDADQADSSTDRADGTEGAAETDPRDRSTGPRTSARAA